MATQNEYTLSGKACVVLTLFFLRVHLVDRLHRCRRRLVKVIVEVITDENEVSAILSACFNLGCVFPLGFTWWFFFCITCDVTSLECSIPLTKCILFYHLWQVPSDVFHSIKTNGIHTFFNCKQMTHNI